MEDRVHIGLVHHKECHAAGVEDAAAQEEEATPEAEGTEGGTYAHQDAPTHEKITAQREFMEFLQINRSKRDAQRRTSPYEAEDGPTHPFGMRANGYQGVGGICTCNQQIDGAMVKDLKDLFGSQSGRKSMIDTAHGIENDHGAAIDGTADHAVDVSVKCCHNNTQRGKCDTQAAAHDVGDHVEDLFPAGIMGEFTLR